MNWLASNWVWLVLIVGMFAMHFFGHGGHGHGYAGHHHEGADDPDRNRTPADRTGNARTGAPGEHRHASSADAYARSGSTVPNVAPEQASIDRDPSSAGHAGHDDAASTGSRRHRHRC